MSINPRLVPSYLKSLPQWLLWRLEDRGGKKPTKIPYSTHGGMAKSNDPSTWASYDQALETYQRGGYDGIGFVLCEGDRLVGIDLDDCIGPDGIPNATAIEIIERFGLVAYIEISPSGKGLRLFTYGTAERSGKGTGDNKWIEVYDHTSPRYLTITGNALHGYTRSIKEGAGALAWLHQKYMVKDEPAPIRVAPTRPANMSDRDILERAENAANGSEFRRLYNGDAGKDHSSADLAFCNMLAFWCACDAGQMDRIFRGSGLMRDKWDRSVGKAGTYGESTIAKAISDCRETYDPTRGRAETPAPRSIPSGPPAEIIELDVGNSAWENDLIRTEPNRNGVSYVKSYPVNALRILTHDQRWCGVLGFDEFKNCAVFLQRPEFAPEYAIEFERGQVVEELDIDRITYWLSEHWGINLNPDRCARIVETVARQRTFHPVREYLNSLTWDGVPRIGNWLDTYMQARAATPEQGEYIQLVGKWWLMSAVARIMVPGAKADYVLVLEGHEGIRKSSALKLLAGDWFTDAALDLNNKDAYLQINGSWIVEIAELDALMRTESSTAKAFFTRATDKFRPPYARKTIELERQCVCAGTVNHNDYIKDYTGGRRYWPVWCNKADLEALARDRDQIWAEALHCYREGERYWPEGKHQRQLCRVEQEARQLDDPWESDIVYWLVGRNSATSGGILEHAIKMDRDKWTRSHQTRIGQIMTRLGWERRRGRDEDGKMQTIYVPPTQGGDDDD